MSGLFVLALAAMEIGGASTCPSPAEVKARLAPLLSPGFEAHTADVATLEEAKDGAVAVLLDGPDGGAIAHRRLPRAATCDEQAERVAVALAAWEAQLHPEITLRLDELKPAAAPAPPPPVAPTARAGPPTVAIAPAAPHAALAAASLGIALLGDWQAGSLAPGGRIDLTLGPSDQPWRGRVGLSGVGLHTQDLMPGEVRWWRLYLTLGADAVIGLGDLWAASVGASGIAGLVSIQGAGYSVDRSPRSLDLGGELVARVGWRRGRVRPWLGVMVAGWLRRQEVFVTTGASESASAALPRVEPAAALGADFSWSP